MSRKFQPYQTFDSGTKTSQKVLWHSNGNISGMHRSLFHPLATVRHRMWAGPETNKTEHNKKHKGAFREYAKSPNTVKTLIHTFVNKNIVKTENLPVMFIILNVVVMCLHVGTTKYLNIKFWLQQILAFGNPACCILFVNCGYNPLRSRTVQWTLKYSCMPLTVADENTV